MNRPRSSERSHYRFCPFCGQVLLRARIHGRDRPTCASCGFVQWRNPAVGVAAILTESDLLRLLGTEAVLRGQWDPAWRPDPGAERILLVRRAASYPGTWCLPCGYVEYDEEVREALARELAEETGLQIRVEELFAAHSNFHEPEKQTVGIWFRAKPVGGSLRPGDDVDAIGLYPPAAPPELAFPTDGAVLRALARTPR